MASSSRPPRPGFRGILAVLTALVLVALGATSASGHSYLRDSSPTEGATLKRFPGQVTLVFSDMILKTGVGLTLQGPDGAVPLDADPANKSVAAPWPAVSRATGDYTLDYRVVSQDGHVMSGAINFAVAAQATASSTDKTDVAPTAAAPATTTQSAESATTDTAPQSVPVWLLGGGVLLALGAVVIVLRRRNGAH